MGPKCWHVLLIEDLPIYVGIIKTIILKHGSVLEVASNLEEGINKAQNNTYDVVLLDLGLPDSRGFATFEVFQQNCPRVPVIILSSTDDEQIAIQAMHNGAQDYLVKGAYLTNDENGSLLFMRSIAYAIERHKIQMDLFAERSSLEHRVEERTNELQRANAHLRVLASSLVSAQEDERRRISLELHDEAGQFLTALRLSLNQIQNELSTISSPLVNHIQEANSLTEAIINKLRILAHDLRPPAIDTVGLNQALNDYCQRIARQTAMEVIYSGTRVIDPPNFIQISLYRAAQEALTNVVKHAKASQVEVRLGGDAEEISLIIRDNGCGFNLREVFPQNSLGGIGLLGIHDRIEAIGGKLTIDSQPGEGTQISIRIPINGDI